MNNDPHEQSNSERRQELRDDQEAFQLRKEEKRLKTGQRSYTFVWIINSIYFLVGSLEILLTLRLLLRFTGANAQNTVALFITNLSAPFIAPFYNLFTNSNSGSNIFDINVLVAIIVYALLGWLGIGLIRFIYAR